MQYSLQTDVWFKYSSSLSLRNCSGYAMLSPCFVRFSVPLQTSKTGKESFIGVWGGVNRSRKRWGTPSLPPKKKNKFSPWLYCICLLMILIPPESCFLESWILVWLVVCLICIYTTFICVFYPQT